MSFREIIIGFFPAAVFLQVGVENKGGDMAEKILMLFVAAFISVLSQLSIKYFERKFKK